MNPRLVFQPIRRLHRAQHIFNILYWQKSLAPISSSLLGKWDCDRASTVENTCRKYCTQTVNTQSQKSVIKDNGQDKNGFSQSKIEELKTNLNHMVKVLFVQSTDYRLLHKDIILENNLFGQNKTSKGMLSYAINVLRLRTHFYFWHINVIMNITETKLLDSEDLVIRVNWALSAINQRSALKFWNFLSSSAKDVLIINGYSDFHIGQDGLVHKHRISRV